MAFISPYHQNLLERITYSPRKVLVEKRAEGIKGPMKKSV
jgi:hypothetical protein